MSKIKWSFGCHATTVAASLTCSDVGAVFCVELFFVERFRLFGELFWYLDISRLAMISDNFSSKSWHQNLSDETNKMKFIRNRS